MRLATTESWSLSLEQQLMQDMALHLAYVASESYHLTAQIDQNPGIYAQGGTRTTYPEFGEINEVQSLATSSYQSLQAELEKRMSHNLQFQSSFTWSKVIDLTSLGATVNSPNIGDPFDLRHNRGISDLNVPLISITSLIYNTPSLHTWNAVAKNVLGDWQVSTIFTLQSGAPFSIVGGANGSDNSESLQYKDRADVVPGVHACVKCGNKQNWLDHYVSTGAFQPNSPGTFGDSGRNLFKTPHINTDDMAIAKNWQIQERYGLQFRWEMFNAFNHTSYGAPNNNPTSSNFGQILRTGAIPPRVMQGALKFTF
jgi:hypothetical protein